MGGASGCVYVSTEEMLCSGFSPLLLCGLYLIRSLNPGCQDVFACFFTEIQKFSRYCFNLYLKYKPQCKLPLDCCYFYEVTYLNLIYLDMQDCWLENETILISSSPTPSPHCTSVSRGWRVGRIMI